jgi:hypothetical protein
MTRLPRVACLAGVLAAAGGSGCGGETIRLGDCPHTMVPASQVVWIGDSWVTIPGNQVTGVESLAQQAGAIGASDAYTVDAKNGTLMAQIAAQYVAREATTPVKVLIMDGGTLDTIMNDSPTTVSSVVGTFSDLLTTIANDRTVTDVIYFLVPELPAIAGVAELRPLLEQACMVSTVPCHFLDLQRFWSDTYTSSVAGGIFPNDMGGQVIASQIWAVMQASCIAQ